MLLKGERAVDFSLYGTDLKTYRLSSLFGKKIVLVFYPGAFTSVCQKELCTFRDSLANFERLDAQVIGISVDGPFANRAFKDQNSLSFPLLSDPGGEISRKYGGVHEDFAGVRGLSVAKRAVFIIDREGKIVYSWVSDDPKIEANYNEISDRLEKI